MKKYCLRGGLVSALLSICASSSMHSFTSSHIIYYYDSNSAIYLYTLGDVTLQNELLSILVKYFWEIKKTNYNEAQRLYFNTDNRDGMESSIGPRSLLTLN